MGVVSNRFFVTAIQDGTIANAVIYSDKTLSQLIGDDGSATPDWENDSTSRPTIYCVTRKGATLTAPADWAWKCNNTAITFTGTPVVDVTISDDGGFMYTEKTISGINFPAIKPIKNIDELPEGSDNNVISCSGHISVGTAAIDFDVSTTMRKTTLSSSGYFAWVEGDSFVTGQNETAEMKAYLNNGSNAVTSFSSEWSIEGQQGGAGWPKFPVEPTSPNTYASTTIAGSDFTDYAVVRVDFYNNRSKGTLLATAFWGVDDMEDMEEMYICSYNTSIRSGLDVSLRESQTAQFVAWMGKRGDELTVDTKYTRFYCKLLNSEGSPITSNFSGVTTPYGEISPDGEGWFEITTSTTAPVVAANAGKVTVSASFAAANGGRVTGLVKATSAS